MSRFDDRFSEVLARLGRRASVTAEACAQRWRRFAEDCVAGFPWDLEDYSNDVTLGTALHTALADEALREADPRRAGALEREIAEADEMLRPVLAPDAFPRAPEHEWWRRGAPRYAARRFCAEFEKAYGVAVRPCSKYDDDVDALARLAAEGRTAADACLLARDEGWYVGERPELLYRAVRDAFGLGRKERRALWSWVRGELDDGGLREALAHGGGAGDGGGRTDGDPGGGPGRS